MFKGFSVLNADQGVENALLLTQNDLTATDGIPRMPVSMFLLLI